MQRTAAPLVAAWRRCHIRGDWRGGPAAILRSRARSCSRTFIQLPGAGAPQPPLCKGGTAWQSHAGGIGGVAPLPYCAPAPDHATWQNDTIGFTIPPAAFAATSLCTREASLLPGKQPAKAKKVMDPASRWRSTKANSAISRRQERWRRHAGEPFCQFPESPGWWDFPGRAGPAGPGRTSHKYPKTRSCLRGTAPPPPRLPR